ncbi:hypothetical protein KKD19_04215 [Patescibacteria group bacterium]|nr:hypothetical protein [Patescibacteria group bacterium]MCG2693441.1 hypothetical protein [Candidatus Parcubacteria bacterium]
MTKKDMSANGGRKTMILLALIAIFSLALGQNVSAIGIISNPIDIKNALRNETFQETLKLFNSEETETYYQLIAEGDIVDWVTFYEVNDLDNPVTKVLAPVQAYYDVAVMLKIPEDAANGEYTGKLTVILTPGEAEGEKASAAVRQRVSREVYITVTDHEDIKLDVSVIPHTYDLTKDENLTIRLIYDNQGNVSLKPQIDFKISNADGKTVYNAIFPYPDEEPAVKPLARYEIPAIEIPTNNLEADYYRAELDFLVSDEIITQEDFKFSIVTDNWLALLGYKQLAIIVLILTVIVAIIFVKKRK